jgi:hypothetical protein
VGEAISALFAGYVQDTYGYSAEGLAGILSLVSLVFCLLWGGYVFLLEPRLQNKLVTAREVERLV